jgi:hypothetical protein
MTRTSLASHAVESSSSRLARTCALLVIALAGLGGCTEPATPATAGGKLAHQGAEHWYPLEKGAMWTFVVRLDVARDGMLSISRVTMRDGDDANVLTGDRAQSLRIVADGIVRVPSKAYLLKVPFALGDQWPGIEGATVAVTQVDQTVTVEAGTFHGCVETTETRGDGMGAETLKTVYCPEVGPVAMESFAPGGEAMPPQRIIGKLRAYGPPLDLDGKPTTSR